MTTSTLDLTVIICAHNPRQDYFQRAIESIAKQSLPTERWEFIVIDNASKLPLKDSLDLSWHPAGRVVLEEKLGLTQARLRAIAEARGELILFVDDDNVLNEDFLENVLKISDTHPTLGVWGGNIEPEFEVQPPEETRPLWPSLALREVSQDRWSNFYFYPEPCGAGMTLRRAVATAYRSSVLASDTRQSLGRIGTSLGSSEDNDILHTAIELGYGIGMFKDLRLLHLIDKRRCNEAYLLKLIEGISCSLVLLEYEWSRSKPHAPTPQASWKRRAFDKSMRSLESLLASRIERRRQQAIKSGKLKAAETIAKMESGPTHS